VYSAPMNPKIIAALALLSIAHAHAGDIVNLTWKKSASEADNAKTAVLTLAAGESAKVRFSEASDDSSVARLEIATGGIVIPATPPNINWPQEVAGPATLRLVPYSASPTPAEGYLITVEVTRPASPSVTPSNAAVIPVDANGTFTVILESSTDLITWTAANPGDYSGNTVKRFFRTRIVKK
jgi:hypothetical protein